MCVYLVLLNKDTLVEPRGGYQQSNPAVQQAALASKLPPLPSVTSKLESSVAFSSDRPQQPYSIGVKTVTGCFILSVHGDGTRGATATYLERCALVEAPGQQLASLDGDRRQLPLALQNVPDGVDVGHIGLLFIVHRNLPIPGSESTDKRFIINIQTAKSSVCVDRYDNSNSLM
ncbi:hypothetical protein EYF80_011166 [Liparis tanakae]|uniref:Uncharacterized protein n=1 Tax=Liparis tanakae TaxID=230148 RepID=A0A4Z2ILA5_9TELE|nr:hypothetical protein EYF80_011166 [Liparis tanakae]